jgi:hypothetical protein
MSSGKNTYNEFGKLPVGNKIHTIYIGKSPQVRIAK